MGLGPNRDPRPKNGDAYDLLSSDLLSVKTGVLTHPFEAREKELLKLAKQWMGKLPFREADLLLIDRIGKNISGTGMDTNVVGRRHHEHMASDGEYPKVRFIAVRGLTRETHGSAVGLGIAEFCKSQVLRETDIEATRLNCIIAGHPTAAMLPLDYETDREILMLRCFEGLDNQQAATLLELNPETTKKRFTRALLRLQQVLREAGVTEDGP